VALHVDVVAFAGEPPSEAALLAHLRAQVGDVTGIESYTVEGRRAVLGSLLDPYTRPYALAFLLAQGGTRVDHRTGAPAPARLPEHVRTPWLALSRWRRFRITAAFHRALWFGGKPPW
jgi:hypothetical protein